MKKVWIKYFLKFKMNDHDLFFFMKYSNMEAHIVEHEIST